MSTRRVREIGILVAAMGLAACAEPLRSPQPHPEGFGIAGDSGTVGEAQPAFSGFAGTGGGRSVSLSLPATVTTAEKPVPPISGGTLLALADGKTAVASDPDRDRIYVVDLETFTLRGTVMLQSGDEPGRVVEDGARRVHVALRRGGALVTIDPATATLAARRAVCSAPRGLAYQATGDQVHVACAGGELVSLPAAGGAATRTLALESDLRDVVVGADGGLMVSTFRRAEVLLVAKDGTIGNRLRPGTGLIMGSAVQARTMSPGVAWRMVPLKDAAGSVVVLHQTAVEGEPIEAVPGGYGGPPGSEGCGSIVQAGVSVLTPGGSTPVVAGGISKASLVVDVAVSPDGTRMALAVPGNGATTFPSVMVGSVQTNASSVMGCWFLESTVTAPPRGEVVSVSYATNTFLLAQTREPATLWRADTGEKIVLSNEERADSGHQIFHVNAGAGIACASCHPEGGEDGRTWTFALQGPRRTQSIRGRISDTAPFHWDGTESDISRLMDDVFVGRMSGPVLSQEQKGALAGWIDSIPAMPAVAGLDAAAVERGKALFHDAKLGCAACHAGALLTNNATVDVGTGLLLQVPSLRGLSWRAPYMHDGCAATLADRFGKATCSGGDKHGVTSQLMPTQRADLTTYLQSL